MFKMKFWLTFGLMTLIVVLLAVAVFGAKPVKEPTKLDLINSYTEEKGVTILDYGKEDNTHYWAKVIKDGKNYTMIVSKAQVLEYWNNINGG